MPIEAPREVNLTIDTLVTEESLAEKIEQFEQSDTQLVLIDVAFEGIGKLKKVLLSLRAESMASVVTLEKPLEKPGDGELRSAMVLLRDSDQLLLQNILSAASSVIPEKHAKILEQEARIESKWFREWVLADHDTRLIRYSGIPWRSFIRKTVDENYRFVTALLENKNADSVIGGFLKQKKQAVCIFPKSWKQNEATH